MDYIWCRLSTFGPRRGTRLQARLEHLESLNHHQLLKLGIPEKEKERIESFLGYSNVLRRFCETPGDIIILIVHDRLGI